MKGPFFILPSDLKYKVMIIQLPKETPWIIAYDHHLYYVYVSNSPTLTAVRYGRESSWMLSYSLIISWAAQYFIWDEMISLLLCFLQTYNNNLLLTRSITKPKITVKCLSLSTHWTQNEQFSKKGNFGVWPFLSDYTKCVISCLRQPAIGVISSLQDLYYVRYGNQCQNQTKIYCIKNYSIFQLFRLNYSKYSVCLQADRFWDRQTRNVRPILIQQSTVFIAILQKYISGQG